MDSRDQTFRHEVANLAKDVFRIYLEDTAATHAAEQNRVLEVSKLGNTGSHLPALTELACKHLQKDIQSFARIHAMEFTRFGLPCDVRVEPELELTARQLAGGTYSRIHGQLELIEGRTKKLLALHADSSYITRAIAASMNMAVRKSKISLRRQRIKQQILKKALNEPHRVPKMHTSTELLARLERMMPRLLRKMREDLQTRPLGRDFVLLSKPWLYNGDPRRPVFRYFYEEHDDLEAAIRVLRNYHLVQNSDIRTKNVSHYVMTEELAEYLIGAFGASESSSPEPGIPPKREQLDPNATKRPSSGVAPDARQDLDENTSEVAERARRRQAVVNPILQTKRWKPGRLATEAGVGKNSVYEYLDGTRAKITDENREAIAQALDLKPEQLPD